MKKITLIAVALVTVSFASCKKDHTCTCSDAGSTSTRTTVYTKVSKSTAARDCAAGTRTTTVGSYTGITTCTLN